MPGWRSRDSYRAKTEEGRQRQLANLKRGRVSRPKPPPPKDYSDDPQGWRAEQWTVESGKPWGKVCRPWQEQIHAGLDSHRYSYVQLPRGHAKTTILSQRALFDLRHSPPGSELFVFAADQDQARIAADVIRGAIRRNERLGSGLTLSKYEIVNDATGARLTIMAADAASSFGIIPHRIYADELAAWWGDNAVRLWESIVSSTGKVADCKLAVFTNAGNDFTSVCRQVFEHAKADNEWFFFAPEGEWLATWTDDKWLSHMQRVLPPPTYERLILNKWVQDTRGFADPNNVDGCCCLDGPPDRQPTDETPAVIACDLGLKHDLAVVAAVDYDADTDTYRILEMRCWHGSRQQPVSVESVEDHIAYIGTYHYPGAAVLCDPWQMAGSLERLRKRGVPVEEFTFSEKHLTELTAALWRVVNERRLHWWPSCGAIDARGIHSDLTSEMKQLVIVPKSYGERIDHRAGGYSDRSIAVGMGVWKLSQDTAGPPRPRLWGVKADVDDPLDEWTWQELTAGEYCLDLWYNSGTM